MSVVGDWVLGGSFEAVPDGCLALGKELGYLVGHYRLHILSWDLMSYGLHMSRSVMIAYVCIW